MTSITELLARPESDWNPFAAPLQTDEIADGISILGPRLPLSLQQLYVVCNGGEGSLPYDPWNFILWGLEDLVQINESEHYTKYYPSSLFIGSSGGGEYFGLTEAGRVFFMDPIAGETSMVFVADSFEEFATRIGAQPPDGFPE